MLAQREKAKIGFVGFSPIQDISSPEKLIGSGWRSLLIFFL